MYRQGDVLLVRMPCAKMAELENAPADPRGLVLAEGESSGHHHAVFGRGARLFRYKTDGRMVVVAPDGAEVRVVGGGSGGVDRHTPITLPPGTYEARIQRSWTAAGYSRRVED